MKNDPASKPLEDIAPIEEEAVKNEPARSPPLDMAPIEDEAVKNEPALKPPLERKADPPVPALLRTAAEALAVWIEPATVPMFETMPVLVLE